tara:strand:+ start:715 stop:1302 length:588 start_codon:yes stop_codon:yes gene_type:complete
MLLFSSVSAQTTFGLKLGSNLTRIVGEDAKFNDRSSDFATFGGVVGVVIQGRSDILNWKNELLYSQKGGRWSEDDEYYKLHFNYIELITGPSFLIQDGFAINCGLYTGYLLSAKQIVSDGERKNSYGASKDDLNDLKSRFDYGVNVGFYYALKETILLTLDYNMGFANFLTLADDDKEIAKHSGFQLGVSYSINN